jgi:transaldolase
VSAQDVLKAGTSIWLDDLSRAKISGTDSHSLPSRIATSGVVGVTTNPSIFSAAISGAAEYSADIAQMRGLSVDEIVKKLTTDDVRQACDLFAQIYKDSKGVDGRVSIEVDPRLAHDTAGTIAAGKELWAIINRANVMIKVPATLEGLPAITELIAAGISVNVTLIFSVKRYGQVIDAYMQGIERCEDPSAVHSVASFFISRIDSTVDALLKKICNNKCFSTIRVRQLLQMPILLINCLKRSFLAHVGMRSRKKVRTSSVHCGHLRVLKILHIQIPNMSSN